MSAPLIIAAILAYLGVAVGLLRPAAREYRRQFPEMPDSLSDVLLVAFVWPIGIFVAFGPLLLDHAERWIFKEGE